MAITPPTWAKGAHPTTEGWMKGRELLKAQPFTQAEIDEWYGVPAKAALLLASAKSAVKPTPQPLREVVDDPNPAPTPAPAPQPLHEASPSSDLSKMSKKELETVARDSGVELDRRLSKKRLLETVRGILR
jgi:predicted component of type VI protein secretion system